MTVIKKNIIEIRVLTLDQNADRYYEYFQTIEDLVRWSLKR